MMILHDRVRITLHDAVNAPAAIADVRLARPDKMNALDPAMFAGIRDAIAHVRTLEGCRAVVLGGEGRAFCAGLDMASMASGGSGIDLQGRDDSGANVVQAVAWGWRALPMPVIAAGHGVIFGGGLQILSGADIIIVTPDARLGVMESRWGLVPDMAGWPLWRGRVRDDVLREAAWTAREMTGTEAASLGFATRTADDPLAEAMALAHSIAAINPAAARGIKALANATATHDDRALLALEADVQGAILRTPDQLEAVMARMQKRDPQFRN